MEFSDAELNIFEEVMEVLKTSPVFKSQSMVEETVLSTPGLEIYPNRRRVLCGHKEIRLTVKEYEILRLLVANKGQVLTYGQIYQNVWGGDSLGSESNMIGCHIRRLRGKLSVEEGIAPFQIKCVREVGYCFEANPKY